MLYVVYAAGSQVKNSVMDRACDADRGEDAYRVLMGG
jgi:hypothetical protein